MNKWKPWLVFLSVLGGVFVLSLSTIEVSFERSKDVQFCGSCHTMKPFVSAMQDPKSKLLSAKHYQHSWIAERQCATCHADYGFLGPIENKVRGFRHVFHYYFTPSTNRTLHLYKPFPNENCLHCHGRTSMYNDNPAHQPILDQLHDNEISCIGCHGPVHPSQERPAP